jgi:ubiquinone biosynthesis protein COQ4
MAELAEGCADAGVALPIFLQTGLPMAGMAVAGAQFKLSTEDRQLLWQQYMPWAAQTGLRCADLMSIYYEKHFNEDLQELRARWRITPAPPVPEHLAPKPPKAVASKQAGAAPGMETDSQGAAS